MRGYLYFVINPMMPGLIKIGHTTTSLSQRLSELHTTGVPISFEVAVAFSVTDSESCEQSVHATLSEYRVTDQREFFKLSIKDAVEKTLPVILPYLDTGMGANAVSNILSESEVELLHHIFHAKNEDTFPVMAVRRLGGTRQEAHYLLGELVLKGFLKEKNEIFTLTHKGRKFIIENKMMDEDLLE